VSGRVVPGRGGEISHLEIFAEDITEKKRVEAEQGQAHKMQALGRLAGGVAHDFNNLLLVISGHVEMLLADAEADGEASAGSRDSLLAVQGAAMRAAALTEQMLAFSRARASRIETVDLNELLRKLMSILSRLIREDIEFRLETQDRPVFVRVDPHEIERVVVNLAVNAQDAMPCGGRLTIESCELPANESVSLESGRIEGGDYVRLSVQDTGIGMDREVQARVFEPFFTLRSDTGPQGQGTGLGLSVVYGIVRQHNGYIGIESEPGRGATFRVYLPRATAPSPAAAPGERAAAPKRLPGGSETILLAEDDSAIRRMLTPFLAGLGYRVLAAQDGVEALEVARGWSGEIHLLLTDVVMPGLGGPDLAVQLRAANRPGLRVLFISGYAGNAPGGAADPMAGTALLQKPFSMDRLAGAVREALTVTAA
jgi:signal transduction histidine kinase/ActR/RegA family two-component response regulator